MKIYTLPSIRINNFKDASIKIAKYWEEYLILNLKNTVIYALYFNYDSNYKGDYDFTIGGNYNFPNSKSISIVESSLFRYLSNNMYISSFILILF